MTPSEAQRFQLRERLVKEFGEEPAMTLMESLPPVNWDKLATKEDLTTLEDRVNARFTVVDARFDALRVELGAKIDTGLAEVRGEMAGVRGEMAGVRTEISDVRTELGAKIDTGLAEVRGEMAEVRGETKLGLARQTYVILAGVAAGLAAAMTPIYIALFTGAAG